MARRSHRIATLFLAFLMFAAAACEEAQVPATNGPGASGPLGTGQIGSGTKESVSCPATNISQVAFTGTPEPPAPDDPLGAQGGGEDELNEGEPPPVPDNPDAIVPDAGSFTPAPFPGSGAQGDPQPDDLIIYGGQPAKLKTSYTLQTAEPEVAAKGDRMLVVWNKMAARSFDGGKTFEWLSPWTVFPVADGGFCCDQRAIHIPRQDLWVWVLQYEAKPGKSNTIRLAWAHGDADFDAGKFHTADWRSSDVGLQPGLLFDQPKLGVSNGHAFLSINAFGSSFVQAVVLRIDLEDMADGQPPATDCLTPTEPRTGEQMFGPYPVRAAADTMYIAAHVSNSELGIWSWPDGSSAASFSAAEGHDATGVPIKYPSISPYTCERTGAGHQSDWCFRPARKDNPTDPDRPANDARITTGWYTNGTIGFAWNASQGLGWKYPFIWVEIIDSAKLGDCAALACVVSYPIIFNQSFAIQYAAISPGKDGGLGGMVMTGGGELHLGCAAIGREAGDATTDPWDMTTVATSPVDMPTPNSGDYLGVAAGSGSANAWAGTCMTYDPNLAAGEGGTLIQMAQFGRRRDGP